MSYRLFLIDKMKIYKRKKSGVLVIVPEGEITLDSLSNFLIYMKNLIQNDSSKIVLNFSKVDYIGSLGIQSLIEISQLTKSRNGGLALCELNPHLKKVLDTVSFEHLAIIYNSEEEAVSALQDESSLT
ncbi:MAG: STAS domain-containing protein [Candidatus Omnitrophota bacterium]